MEGMAEWVLTTGRTLGSEEFRGKRANTMQDMSGRQSSVWDHNKNKRPERHNMS